MKLVISLVIATTFLKVYGASSNDNSSIKSLDLRKVKNAIYSVQYQDKPQERVQFKDGMFNKHDDEFILDYRFEIAEKPILVSKSGVAYVVMWDSTGGTGHWATLKEVNMKSNPPAEAKSFPRIEEDRIQILGISTHGSEVVLDVVKHGPDDPLCCPTKKDTIRYPIK